MQSIWCNFITWSLFGTLNCWKCQVGAILDLNFGRSEFFFWHLSTNIGCQIIILVYPCWEPQLTVPLFGCASKFQFQRIEDLVFTEPTKMFSTNLYTAVSGESHVTYYGDWQSQPELHDTYISGSPPRSVISVTQRYFEGSWMKTAPHCTKSSEWTV